MLAQLLGRASGLGIGDLVTEFIENQTRNAANTSLNVAPEALAALQQLGNLGVLPASSLQAAMQRVMGHASSTAVPGEGVQSYSVGQLQTAILAMYQVVPRPAEGGPGPVRGRGGPGTTGGLVMRCPGLRRTDRGASPGGEWPTAGAQPPAAGC